MSRRAEVNSLEGKAHRILVMEDEQTMAEALKTVLLKQGYSVELAMTGRDALTKCGLEKFDLLIADLRLPDISGMDVIRTIKCSHPLTKVVVITGYPTVPSVVEAMKLGVFDYLLKPFDVDELIRVLSEALKKDGTDHTKTDPDGKDARARLLIQKKEVLKALQWAAADKRFLKDMDEN